MTVRMKGWEVKTIPEQKVIHYGNVTNASLRQRFRKGYNFYTLGYHPFFHLIRCIYRLRETPLLIGSFSEIAGFWYALINRKTEVSDELKQFIRKEQLHKLKLLLRIKQ
jgi:GT2 family glycosyltransferase